MPKKASAVKAQQQQGRERKSGLTSSEREMIHLTLGTTKIEDYLPTTTINNNLKVEDVDDVDEFEKLERLYDNIKEKEVKTTGLDARVLAAQLLPPAERQAALSFTPAELAGIHESLDKTPTNAIPENTEEGIRQLPIWKAFSHAQVPVNDDLIQAMVDEFKIGKLIEQQAAKARKEKESNKHSRVNNYFVLTRQYRQKEQEATEECNRLISKQYRKVSIKLHPDRYGDLYETEFSELMLAYDILKDREIRQKYVQQLLKVMIKGYGFVDKSSTPIGDKIIWQAHHAFFSNHFTEQTEDTAQARFQKQMATTSEARYDKNQMLTKSTQNAKKMKTHFYLEANVYQTPPKAMHITSIQGLTVSIALPPPSCPSDLIQSVSIYTSQNDSNDHGDGRLLLTVKDPNFLSADGEEQYIPIRLQLPEYGIYQLYWKIILKADQYATNLIETPPSKTREVDLENPRSLKARQELPGLLHHATQLIASLKLESRKLNDKKPTSQDNIEIQYWQLHELIAKSRTVSNRLWRCLEILGYSYEEALAYNNNKTTTTGGNSSSGILEKLLTWIDTCGREKSTLDDQIQVAQKKASLKSFQHSVATMMEEGQLADWILRVQSADLINTGAEVNRLYQLLTEGKKAKSNALWVDSISLQNAATRTDLFTTKQCQTLLARATEIEAKMVEETQRLLAAKQQQDQEEAERKRMEQQVAELNGLPLGTTVVLKDLVSRMDLNGCTGIYRGLPVGKGSSGNNRYIVRVGGIDMALHKKNFEPWKGGDVPPVPVQAPPSSSWQCSACTVINQGKDALKDICPLCETPRNGVKQKQAKAKTTTTTAGKKPAASVQTATAPSKSAAGNSKAAPHLATKKTAIPPKKVTPMPTVRTAATTPTIKVKAPTAATLTLNLKWAEKPIKKPMNAAPPPKLNAQQQQGLLFTKPSTMNNNSNNKHHHHQQQQASSSSTKEPLPVRKVTMWIPQNLVSAFIGKKGCNVKAMNVESGAHIKVDKFKTNNRGSCAVYLEGKPTEIVAAQMCVERFLQEHCKTVKKDVVIEAPSPTRQAVAPAPLASTSHKAAPAPVTTSKSTPKVDSSVGRQTPTTVSIPDSISILSPQASGEDASGVTDTMENAAAATSVAAAAPPPAMPTSPPNQMDILFLFLCQQANCLKCKPEVFYQFLREQDIEELNDLNEAVNDDDFLREMQSSGLKGFKKAAFKRAVATAANDTDLIIIPTVDNGLKAPSTTAASAANNNIQMELECPICYELMVNDPVLASDGYTYERHAIESWFEKHKGSPDGIRSPKTNLLMKDLNLVPNKTMLAMARDAAAARRA